MPNVSQNHKQLDNEIHSQYELVKDLMYSKSQLEREREENSFEIAKEYSRLTQERRLAQMEMAKINEQRELIEREKEKLGNMAVAFQAAGIEI